MNSFNYRIVCYSCDIGENRIPQAIDSKGLNLTLRCHQIVINIYLTDSCVLHGCVSCVFFLGVLHDAALCVLLALGIYLSHVDFVYQTGQIYNI